MMAAACCASSSLSFIGEVAAHSLFRLREGRRRMKREGRHRIARRHAPSLAKTLTTHFDQSMLGMPKDAGTELSGPELLQNIEIELSDIL